MMDPSLADTIKVNAPVWVWDGHWLPAVVVGPGLTSEFLVVRFEHGVSAPMPSANIRPRRPSLGGADSPSTIAPLVADLARSGRRSPEALNIATQIALLSAPQRLDGVSVLVVGDEADTCEAVGALLEALGARATAATSARAALAILDTLHPNAIVTDIRMPLEDGYFLARELRKRERNSKQHHLPLVALTGYGGREDKSQFLTAGFDGHILKPIDPVELSRILGTLVTPRQEVRAL
ncbi:MAG: response regulator [Deltaproteobacteria bacterium]|nr:response regulator [Deltaproteobacteria bacterium]